MKKKDLEKKIKKLEKTLEIKENTIRLLLSYLDNNEKLKSFNKEVND